MAVEDTTLALATTSPPRAAIVAVVAGHEQLAADREVDRSAEGDDRVLDRRDAVALRRALLPFDLSSLPCDVIDVSSEPAELAATDILPDDAPVLAIGSRVVVTAPVALLPAHRTIPVRLPLEIRRPTGMSAVRSRAKVSSERCACPA